MKAASSTRKQLLTPGGLLTEAGYTDALVALAAEMKAKREAKVAPAATGKSQKAVSTGFTLASDDARKVAFSKELDQIDAQRQRTKRYKDPVADAKRIKIKAA